MQFVRPTATRSSSARPAGWLPVPREPPRRPTADAGGGFADRNVDGLHLRVLTAPLGRGAVQVARPLEAPTASSSACAVLVAARAVGTALGAGVSRLFSGRVVAP